MFKNRKMLIRVTAIILCVLIVLSVFSILFASLNF